MKLRLDPVLVPGGITAAGQMCLSSAGSRSEQEEVQVSCRRPERFKSNHFVGQRAAAATQTS